MYQLYNLLLILSAAVLVPYYLLRGLRYGKNRRGIRERLGHYTPEQLSVIQGRKVVWVHAVSVGETRAAAPLLGGLRKAYPDHLILLTNVTETGHSIARENPDVDLCLFFPFDFSWTVRHVLQTVRPEVIVIVETEIWPNFTCQASLLKIPVLLVNGRISDRSFPRYRLFRFLLKPVLRCFAGFCMQSQLDAERIVQLGAAMTQVENTGNLKFDHELRNISDEAFLQLREEYRVPQGMQVIAAGSTHAGEEEQILAVYKELLAQGKELLLLLIPRHPERCREVIGLLEAQGLDYCLRSRLTPEASLLRSGQVLLVDTLGEVLNLYSAADLVFVGGSLVPVGGHNLLEASLCGKPVLFGPHVQNFREISTKLARSGAGIRVENQQQLLEYCALLLDDRVRSRAMGQAGRALLTENAGATERSLKRIAEYL